MYDSTPTFPGFEIVKPFRFQGSPYEYKVTALRECPTPESLQLCDTPEKAAEYWRLHVEKHPHFNPECECVAVLLKVTRDLIRAGQLVKIDVLDHVVVGVPKYVSLRELGYFCSGG